MVSCSSSFKTIDYESVQRTVSYAATDFEIVDKSNWFNDSLGDSLFNANYVQNTGNDILNIVVSSYENQLPDLEFVMNEDSDIEFRIQSVEVKRGLFTFNFAHPGPLYRMKMKGEIVEHGVVVDTFVLKELVNMAEINFGDESTKWMSKEEKGNKEYQLKTFRVGLRKLYQQLYFNYFDIKLSA